MQRAVCTRHVEKRPLAHRVDEDDRRRGRNAPSRSNRPVDRLRARPGAGGGSRRRGRRRPCRRPPPAGRARRARSPCSGRILRHVRRSRRRRRASPRVADRRPGARSRRRRRCRGRRRPPSHRGRGRRSGAPAGRPPRECARLRQALRRRNRDAAGAPSILPSPSTTRRIANRPLASTCQSAPEEGPGLGRQTEDGLVRAQVERGHAQPPIRDRGGCPPVGSESHATRRGARDPSAPAARR